MWVDSESGGSPAWYGWDEVSDRRKKLRRAMDVALKRHDALTAESDPVEKHEACSDVERTYKQFHYLDSMDIIIRQGEFDGTEQHIDMTDDQIQLNRHVRCAEGVPIITRHNATAPPAIPFRQVFSREESASRAWHVYSHKAPPPKRAEVASSSSGQPFTSFKAPPPPREPSFKAPPPTSPMVVSSSPG
jgi:hypothetical protein